MLVTSIRCPDHNRICDLVVGVFTQYAIGMKREQHAMELIFAHPQYAPHFAQSNSMSCFIGPVKIEKGESYYSKQRELVGKTVLQCALAKQMPQLARLALDHMDMTFQDDLLEAVACASDLADEIAAKCAHISLSGTSCIASEAADLLHEHKMRLVELVTKHGIGVSVDDGSCRIDPFVSPNMPLQLLQYVVGHPDAAQWRDQILRDAALAAVEVGNIDAVRWLAEEVGRREDVTRLLSRVRGESMARELLRLGADVDQPAPHNNLSPLQEAVVAGNVEKIRMWADLGADLALRTPGKNGKPGKTLLQLNANEEIKRLVRALKVGAALGAAMELDEELTPSTSSTSKGPAPL